MESCSVKAEDILVEEGENLTEEVGQNSLYLCLFCRLRGSKVMCYLKALRSGSSPTHHSCCWTEEEARSRYLIPV